MKMLRLPLFLGVMLSFFDGGDALDIEILEPTRATGDEVALIFTSGGFLQGKHYRKTAQAIQEASELRVWVALTGDYLQSISGGYPIKKEVEGAISELEKAGMTSEAYIGVAHGIGGHFLLPYAENSKLKAIILMGFTLPRDTKPQDHTLPVLTLAAELDGVTRITRMAEEYGKLKKDMGHSSITLYRAPVIFLEGINHGQFASGSMPSRITNNDIVPDITEEDAHRLIGNHVNSFLTATFSSSIPEMDNAFKELEEAFSITSEALQPFLDVKALDGNGNSSQWTIIAQEYIAGNFADQIQVRDQVGQGPWFFNSKPSITQHGDLATVKTKSLVHTVLKSSGMFSIRESPIEIDMKLKSKDAIWEALTSGDNGTQLDGPHTSLRSEPKTCKSLNELALEVALNHSSPEARDRYKSRGRPIIFEEDSVSVSMLTWSMRPFDIWENKSGLHVRAIAYVTSMKSWLSPGVLYCKVMSPYRAMEWVNFESLHPPPPSVFPSLL